MLLILVNQGPFTYKRGNFGLRLVGQLDAEYLPELNAQIQAREGRIELELDELTLVDRDAIRFFIDCEAQGIELRGCPAYIREWIARERPNQR
jgi:hypothetical protein